MDFIRKVKNENGALMVVALMMICLMNIIGIASITTSRMEILISNTEREQVGSFYTAEAGVQQIKANLQNLFVDRNNVKIASGATPDWDFALDGSETGVSSAAGLTYATGAQWVSSGTLSGYTYTVTVWNNDDDGSATNDTDSIIYARSVAAAPRGGSTAVEVTLYGSVSGGAAIIGYAAQAGGAAGKNYNSVDADAITTFNSQL